MRSYASPQTQAEGNILIVDHFIKEVNKFYAHLRKLWLFFYVAKLKISQNFMLFMTINLEIWFVLLK